jgi:hypothetical protein
VLRRIILLSWIVEHLRTENHICFVKGRDCYAFHTGYHTTWVPELNGIPNAKESAIFHMNPYWYIKIMNSSISKADNERISPSLVMTSFHSLSISNAYTPAQRKSIVYYN